MNALEKQVSRPSSKSRMPSAKLTTLGHFRIEKVAESPPVTLCKQPEGYAAYWREVIAPSPFFHPDKEHVVVVAVDVRMRTKGWHLVSVGTLSSCDVHAREILRPVLLCGAWAFILMHNHPSGDASPSDLDKQVTARIHELGELMAVPLVDHIIISDTGERYFSFRECGMIPVPA